MRFGPFELREGALAREGRPLAVGQRALALLEALAAAEGAVDKAALMEAGWPGTIVEEGNLTVQIAALRKALGPREDGQEWIVTVPRVGYRLARGEAMATDTAGPVRMALVTVLPFQNLSGDPAQDYFADGIVDELIAALSRFRSFAVNARSSSFAWKGRRADVRQMAAELGARYLLDGSVRRGGDRLRLVAQLADGTDGTTLWTQTFEGAVSDVFEFQDRITGVVAALIEPQIQRAEFEHSRRERPGSMAAYDLYLRAVASLYLFNEAGNAEAIRLLDQAIAIEPDNGVYLGFLAWALEHRITMTWPPAGPDDRARCIAVARRAVDLAPDDATILAHSGLAIQLVSDDYEGGLLVTRRAVEINPNNLAVLINCAAAELIGGDLGRAEALLERAMQVQPAGNHEAMGVLSTVKAAQGLHEEALAWAGRAKASNSQFIPTYWTLVGSNFALGRMDEARAALGQLLRLSPGVTMAHFEGYARPKDRQRDQVIIEAMRALGLPEG
jgi:TolB-like protein/Flp pilus assembly protein TadD